MHAPPRVILLSDLSNESGSTLTATLVLVEDSAVTDMADRFSNNDNNPLIVSLRDDEEGA
jgi:hypothetical protein